MVLPLQLANAHATAQTEGNGDGPPDSLPLQTPGLSDRLRAAAAKTDSLVFVDASLVL